jgi:hypothetical protein
MITVEEFCFVVFFVIVIFLVKLLYLVSKNFDAYRTCISLLCSHGRACESLSAFWIELCHMKFSPGLEGMEAFEGCC